MGLCAEMTATEDHVNSTGSKQQGVFPSLLLLFLPLHISYQIPAIQQFHNFCFYVETINLYASVIYDIINSGNGVPPVRY